MSLDLHSGAMIEWGWRCAFRPILCKLVGCNRASWEILVETVIKGTWRCTPRLWLSKFGDVLWGIDQVKLVEFLELVDLDVVNWKASWVLRRCSLVSYVEIVPIWDVDYTFELCWRASRWQMICTHQQNVIMSLGASRSVWELSDQNRRQVKSQRWLDRRSGLQEHLGAPGSANDNSQSAGAKPGSTSTHCRAVRVKPNLLSEHCWSGWKS